MSRLRFSACTAAAISARAIHGVTFRQDTRTPYIDQGSALLRRELCRLDHIIDVICTLRSGVDQTRHAIGKAQRRPILDSRHMTVDIEQSWHH